MLLQVPHLIVTYRHSLKGPCLPVVLPCFHERFLTLACDWSLGFNSWWWRIWVVFAGDFAKSRLNLGKQTVLRHIPSITFAIISNIRHSQSHSSMSLIPLELSPYAPLSTLGDHPSYNDTTTSSIISQFGG